MKLYEILKGSKIKVTLNNGEETFATFHHIDGMYSYCTIDSLPDNNVVHLSASTPLEKQGDHYVIPLYKL